MSLRSLFLRPDGQFKRSSIAFIVLAAVLMGFVPVGIVLGFGIYDFLKNGPEAARVQAELENELRMISPPSGATSAGLHRSNKPRQALVSNTYCSSLKYVEIRNYYDKELANHGWTFYREVPLKDWGRDFGGKEAEYCKGPYRATIEYAGDGVADSWNYAFSLSWGLGAVFEKYPAEFYQAGCK
jgi:hypothetical protein